MEYGGNQRHHRLKLNSSDLQHIQGVQKSLPNSKEKIQEYLDSLQNPALNKIDLTSQYNQQATLGVNPENNIQSKQTLKSLISKEIYIKNEINVMALDLNNVKRQKCQKMLVDGLVYANQSQMKKFIKQKQYNDVYTLLKVKEALLSPYEEGYAAEMNQMLFEIGDGRNSYTLQTQETSAEQERLSIKELLKQKNQPVLSQGQNKQDQTLNKQANMLKGKSYMEQKSKQDQILESTSHKLPEIRNSIDENVQSIVSYDSPIKNNSQAISSTSLKSCQVQKDRAKLHQRQIFYKVDQIQQDSDEESLESLLGYSKQQKQQNVKKAVSAQTVDQAHNQKNKIGQFEISQNQVNFFILRARHLKYIKTLQQMQTYKAEISKLKSKNETLIKEKAQTMKQLELIDEQISICQLFIHKIKLQAKTQ
eukprot:403365728